MQGVIELKIEIFVVTTELKEKLCSLNKLEELKVELCKEFGGLTVIPNCKGYWMDNDKLINDDVEIWTIYTNSEYGVYGKINAYSLQIKAICNQKTQLFALDGHVYFI